MTRRLGYVLSSLLVVTLTLTLAVVAVDVYDWTRPSTSLDLGPTAADRDQVARLERRVTRLETELHDLGTGLEGVDARVEFDERETVRLQQRFFRLSSDLTVHVVESDRTAQR